MTVTETVMATVLTAAAMVTVVVTVFATRGTAGDLRRNCVERERERSRRA